MMPARPEPDLKLLRVFDEIYRTGSLTATGERMGLSQPTVSIGLAKLRRYFRDPLFVRTSRGMQPTPHAAELLGPVRQALGLLDDALGHRASFDPQQATRPFHICMTDISQVVMLPALLNRLKQMGVPAPIEVSHISADTPAMLEAGEADLAIGFMPQLEAGFYQQALFDQNFICMVRANHPRIGSTLTLAQFTREAHIQITTSGTGHAIIDKTLEARRIGRRIAMRVPNFLGIAHIVAETDFIVTVPQLLGTVLLGTANIKLCVPPVKLPSYQVKQHWHERFHQDPANKWLRALVAELFLASPRTGAEASKAGRKARAPGR
jgi:DNA-binding transcriptional LysR family regulator